MIAVGGDSGTGKTTLCRGIYDIFGAERIETICLDDYHALDRAQRKAAGITALDPRANNFAAMEEDMLTLRQGGTISKPIYDHGDGTFKGRESVEPKDIIVVQGLFPLYTPSLRSLFDVMVWLDPETELKIDWKIQRDVTQRGYRKEEVRSEIERRQHDIAAHINPQGKHADLTVTFKRPRDDPKTKDNALLSARIRKSSRFSPFDYREFADASTHFNLIESTSGFPETIIEIDGGLEDSLSHALQDKIWAHMDSHAHLRPEALGAFSDASGPRISHSLALAQLLIARRVIMVENALLSGVSSSLDAQGS